MVTRFEPARDLDVTVARMVVPVVDRLARRIGDLTRTGAPDGKSWITSHDERVRPSHFHADGQIVPGNLRYVLRRPDHMGSELAVAPRDEDLSLANRVNCRCVSVPLLGIVGETVRVAPAVMNGTRVAAVVDVRFPRVVESEFPRSPDSGGRWMGQAVDAVALEVRQAGARRT